MEQHEILPTGSAIGDRQLTVPHIRERMAASPCPVPLARRGDQDLNPHLAGERLGGLRPAGVLVPIVAHGHGPTILFTRRTAHLNAHAGQVSFPGGRIEPGDADPLDAALRETEEEIGLARDRVEIIGCLDTYVTRTAFEVTPFVGLVHPPVEPVPDPTEVEAVFEVPVRFILQPEQPERHVRRLGGADRAFYVFDWDGQYIWGATAGMLVNLKEILTGEKLPERRPVPAPDGRP